MKKIKDIIRDTEFFSEIKIYNSFTADYFSFINL